jgi:ubiquinone/menaquinone biosynthesis C-methylase UbiE
MTNYVLALSDGEVARYRMMAAKARADEDAQWRAAGIVPGARVADVGCGPGAVMLEMAEIVGPAGSVIGVDAEPDTVATAQGLLDQAGARNTSVQVGQADSSGLDPASFDVVVMRHVLAHNGALEQRIVDHLASLARPGGCVYVVDVAMAGSALRPAEPDLEDLTERYMAFHESRGNDPQIGFRLADLLANAGLEVLDHRGAYSVLTIPPGMRPPPWVARDAMVAAGHATAADVARWQAAFDRVDARADRPTFFVPFFSATGRRPG